jgi:hypothetical protein
VAPRDEEQQVLLRGNALLVGELLGIPQELAEGTPKFCLIPVDLFTESGVE